MSDSSSERWHQSRRGHDWFSRKAVASNAADGVVSPAPVAYATSRIVGATGRSCLSSIPQARRRLHRGPRCWRSRRTAISSSYPIEQTPTSGCICSSTPTTDAHAIPAALPSPARAVVLARVNAALSELVQTSSVVQRRQRGRSRGRSGSRRAPAARAAVDCSFAPGAVTSAARIASLDHAWSGSVGGVAAIATERQSWSSRRAWPFRLGHVESALDRTSCDSRVGVVVTGGGSAPLPQHQWGRDLDAQERTS